MPASNFRISQIPLTSGAWAEVVAPRRCSYVTAEGTDNDIIISTDPADATQQQTVPLGTAKHIGAPPTSERTSAALGARYAPGDTVCYLKSVNPTDTAVLNFLLSLVIALFLAGAARGQVNVPQGTNTQKADVTRIGGTAVPGGVVDTGNTAIKVNCVVGCAGGGGGGGAVTVADGADAALGAKSDAAWDGAAASASVAAILKRVAALLSGTLTTNATVQNASLAVTGTFWQATQPVSGTVAVSNFPASQAVTGTFWQATQPVSGTFWQATQPVSIGSTVTVAGAKSSNNAAPGSTNLGTLPAVATAAPPVLTEGNQVAASADLAGSTRVTGRPPAALGCYSIAGDVGYTAVTAGGIVFSFRWADASRLALVYRVDAGVIVTAFTTAGMIERELVVVRSFTASDTGGTSLLPTGNVNKLRTSHGTTLAADIRVGGFLTAGTGTADANPSGSLMAWMSAVGTAIPMQPLFDATGANMHPLVLAQNEGFRVQLGAVETASTRRTFVRVYWCEAGAY